MEFFNTLLAVDEAAGCSYTGCKDRNRVLACEDSGSHPSFETDHDRASLASF
jgi:hypothetical protein